MRRVHQKIKGYRVLFAYYFELELYEVAKHDVNMQYFMVAVVWAGFTVLKRACLWQVWGYIHNATPNYTILKAVRRIKKHLQIKKDYVL